MRYFLVTVAAALVVSACGGGTEAGGEAGVSDGAAAEPAGVAAQPAAGGSDFCRAVEDLVDDLETFDEDDPGLDGYDLYQFMEDIYRRLAATAPAELEDDFALTISAMERFVEWAQEPTELNPLDDAELQALEEASTRIDSYMDDECGFKLGDDDTEASVGVDEEVPGSDSGGASNAAQTISVGGDTYQETLSGDYEVSCDMYGDLETGSINIYLEGPEFQSSVSSYDSGAEPGTYEGQIWVFASDPALDEAVWDLQEIDGTFVLDHAEAVSDEEWLFSGTFSASVEDPSASIEATFSCVGLIGY